MGNSTEGIRMAISFNTEEPLESSLDDVLAASRPANPGEAKRFRVKLRRGRFHSKVRIITKDVVLPSLYGADSSTIFLIPVLPRSPEVVVADWGRMVGHAYVALDHVPTMVWFAKEMWGRVATADPRYLEFLLGERQRELREQIEQSQDKWEVEKLEVELRQIDDDPWSYPLDRIKEFGGGRR